MTHSPRPSAGLVSLMLVALLAACTGASLPEPAIATPAQTGRSAKALPPAEAPHSNQSPSLRPRPGTRQPPLVAPSSFGAPLAGLTATQSQDFVDGLEEFRNIETVEGGLGPLFNNTGCVVCHAVPATGGSTDLKVTRFGKLTAGGFESLEAQGGSLLQHSAIDRAAREFIPVQANVMALRQSTPLFGLGLIEALDDSTIIANARQPRAPGVHGTVALVTDRPSGQQRVGRFGWKAQVATLLDFSGDAYLNEMGVTSRFYPTENAPNGDLALLAASDTVADPEDQVDPLTGKGDIDHAADFMRYLAPPPRGPQTASSRAGEGVFTTAGCADCHTPQMTTGSNEVAALHHQVVWLYSDLLLHDMGSLADGIAQGPASPAQMKTPPLWGLRASAPYLHDGRASSVDAAIGAHDGEAAFARERYRGLTDAQRQQLLDFLGTL